MDEELKEKWVEALRSGKFTQARGRLQRVGEGAGFCCLGVLCEIDNRMEQHRRDDGRGAVVYRFIPPKSTWPGPSSAGTLPDAYRELIGLTSRQQALLIQMNDGGISFPEIADHIERHL